MRSYIYEGAANGSTNIASPADRLARTHQPEKEILNLLDYRTRYNQYNTDVGERPSQHRFLTSCHASLWPAHLTPGKMKRWILTEFLILRRPSADTKAMRSSAPIIPVWDDHEYAK